MGYKTHAFKGVSWVGVLRASTRLITFIRLAILARILTPTQFGAFGIANLVLSFLEIITETGVNIFLIQKKEDITDYINSAWIVSIIRGIVISIAIIISAPFIVNFFNSPESYPIILLISLVPLIRGFINPSIVKIHKDIQFQKEFYLRSFLFLIDALVVIIVAFITKSAESFAWGLIVSAVLEVMLSFVYFKPTPRLDFESVKVKHIIRRGSWVTLTGIFSYGADNGDNIFVGKMMGTNYLGIYQNAYKISTLPITEITDSVNKVMFPVYTKFSDDKARLLKAFGKVTGVTSLLALVLGAVIFLFAEQIVLIILGQNWILAIPVVKVLALYGILRTIFGNFAPLFLSVEKQNYVAIMTFVRMLALLVIIFPLVSAYGMIGAAYAMIISIIVEIPIILYFSYKVFKK